MQTEFNFRSDSLTYCLETKKNNFTTKKCLEYNFFRVHLQNHN